jgi:nitrogen fixation NifU-like protein
VIGKTIDEARRSANLFKEMMLGSGTAANLPEDMEDLEALEGVKKYPVRVKCALLAWNTLLEGLDQAEKQNPAAE